MLVEGVHRSVTMHAAHASAALRRHVLAFPQSNGPGDTHSSGNADLLRLPQVRTCTGPADIVEVLNRCDTHGPCPHSDAADGLLRALAEAGHTARRSGHAPSGAQWVTVDCGHRGELRISGNAHWTARTDYCQADHIGWLVSPPDEAGDVTPCFDSADCDYVKDTSLLLQMIDRYQAGY